MNLKDAQFLLPEYPRILHLPHLPNATRDDLVASVIDASIIFGSDPICIEEKLDGASLGVRYVDEEELLIRNRNHVLRKGYRKETSAKMQFAPVWSYFYDRRSMLEHLTSLCGDVSVYGEWLLAQHGIRYDKLPALFVAYDLYRSEDQTWIPPALARQYLSEAGFAVPPLFEAKLSSYEQLETWIQQSSPFSSTDLREGVCVKVMKPEGLHRFKKVRSSFIRGQYWSDTRITKNRVLKWESSKK